MCIRDRTGRHAGEYNIDPHKLVISGESAGGHLALITGMLLSLIHISEPTRPY